MIAAIRDCFTCVLVHSVEGNLVLASFSGEIGFKSLTKHMGWAKQPMLERMTAIDPDLPISFIYGAQSWVDRNSGWKVKQARQSYVDVQVILFVPASLC